jgi:hypothetical protein
MSLGQLGVAIILYTYCVSHIFSKVKSASTWFSVINMVLSLIIMPMILFGKNTFFSYLDFIKYLYPYYDLTVAVFFQQNEASIQQLSELTGLTKPTGSTILITIFFYIIVLILIEVMPLSRLKAYFGDVNDSRIN